MVRVLQIVTKMDRGGLETMLMNYYRQIDRNKVQFDFLVHRSERGVYDDEIEALGGVIYRIQRLNPLSLGYYRTLNIFFDSYKEKYRIVHSHLDCMSAYPLRAAKRAGIPIRIAHAHSTSQDRDWKYWFKLFSLQIIPRYATDYFACGKEAAKWMFGDCPAIILPNAINAEDYIFNQAMREKVRSQFGIMTDELLIGHVGRFSPPKNHDFLVDVFAEVLKQRKAKLLLVGIGPLQEHIKNRVDILQLSEKVIFAGLRSDVSQLLQAMDVFIFPSIYEGLPLTVIEAQAAGLPCIISDKVPIECKKTDLVQQVELSKGVSVWANIAIRAGKIVRKNTYAQICSARFDIADNAKWLESYYVKKWGLNDE